MIRIARPDSSGCSPTGSGRTSWFPAEGHVIALTVDGTRRLLVWGQDDDGHDRLATDEVRVRSWTSLAECAAEARTHGCVLVGDQDGTAVTEVATEPVVAWLRGARKAVPDDAALTLWNLAGDVARSVGRVLDDHGTWARRCHTKLTVACVPWAFGQDEYRPRWHPLELRALRRVLGASIAVVRLALR